MTSLLYMLAQTVPATTGAAGGSGSAGGGAGGATEPEFTVDWSKWLNIHGWMTGVRAGVVFVLILLLGFLLARASAKLLNKYQLTRPVRWGTLAIAAYTALIVLHYGRMVDPNDILALAIHKLFMAIMLLVGLRFLDRLVIIPVLTRGGRVTLSRFVHQITLAILTGFVATAYLHSAFGVDVSSLLAGSAVISIVLGLALQETLGNFFSGMVLQASVPFAGGDWIMIGEGSSAVEGRVVEMTWRAVTLLTPSNNNVLIPNSVVARTRITNYHTPSPATACSINVALDHDLPPHEVRRVLLLAANDTPGVLQNPGPGVSISSYDLATTTYSLGFWIDKPDQHGGIEVAVRWNVWYRLNQAGYRLPLDAKMIHLVDPAGLKQAGEDRVLAERLAAIQRSPLFSTLAPEMQRELATEVRDFSLSEGQVFYRQDDPGNSLFLVLSGTVHASLHTEDGRDVDLGDTSIGGVFGEVSAVTGLPRTATVSAKTSVRAMEITHQHLQKLMARDASLAGHISEVVAASQARREEISRQLGAQHPTHGQNTQAQSVLDRMKAFLGLGAGS